MKAALLSILFLALSCNSWGKFWDVNTGPFLIEQISPADASQNNAATSSIVITFSRPVVLAGVVTDSIQCTGSVQVSINGFVSCIRLSSVTLAANAMSISIQTVGVPLGQTAKVKISTAIQSTTGQVLSAEYISGGFKTTNPPCGAGNCFLAAAAHGAIPAAGVHYFLITSGVHAGKFMVVMGGGTGTVLYNPQAGTFNGGPTTAGTVGNGAHSITLKSGPNAGKTLVYLGGVATGNDLYDPQTNMFTSNAAAAGAINTGAYSVEILSGIHQGRYLTFLPTGGNTILYNPATNSWVGGAVVGASASTGAFSFFIESGINAGKTYLILSNSSTAAYLLTHGVDHTATSPVSASTSQATINSPSAFYVRSGPQVGKMLLINASVSNLSEYYTLSTGIWSAGPNLTANASSGSASYPISYGANAGKVFVILGGGIATTNLFDPQAQVFVTGTAMPFSISSNTPTFFVENGIYPQTVVIMGASQYTVYFP